GDPLQGGRAGERRCRVAAAGEVEFLWAGNRPVNKEEFMRFILKVAAVLAALTVGAAQAQYPQRPIQLIVPWGAGGGTDATARIIAALMEKDLKQPINVVNRTGGSGVVGHDAIAKAAPDGYTIGLITVEITMMHHVGLTALKYSD